MAASRGALGAAAVLALVVYATATAPLNLTVPDYVLPVFTRNIHHAEDQAPASLWQAVALETFYPIPSLWQAVGLSTDSTDSTRRLIFAIHAAATYNITWGAVVPLNELAEIQKSPPLWLWARTLGEVVGLLPDGSGIRVFEMDEVAVLPDHSKALEDLAAAEAAHLETGSQAGPSLDALNAAKAASESTAVAVASIVDLIRPSPRGQPASSLPLLVAELVFPDPTVLVPPLDGVAVMFSLAPGRESDYVKPRRFEMYVTECTGKYINSATHFCAANNVSCDAGVSYRQPVFGGAGTFLGMQDAHSCEGANTKSAIIWIPQLALALQDLIHEAMLSMRRNSATRIAGPLGALTTMAVAAASALSAMAV